MNLENKFLFGIAIFITIFLMIWFVLPKKHQGYYMKTSVNDSYPVFRIMNDWSFWGDSTAFITANKKEVIDTFSKLRNNQ